MNRHVYNACMLIGWALVSTGAGLVHLPSGLMVAGGLLLALTINAARLAGGAR